MRIPLLTHSAEGGAIAAYPQECINFYYIPPAPGDMHQGVLAPVHGTTLFDTLANTGDIRATLFNPDDSLLYVVSDNDFYEVTSAAVETDRGNLSTTSGHVEMALDPAGAEIVIVDGTNGYTFDVSGNSFATISDGDYPDTATTVDYIDGYFLVNVPGTPGRFQWSNLNDGTAWESTDLATAASLSGDVKKILVDKHDIYLFGEYRTELWYNSGDTSQTFQPFEYIETGIAAPATAHRFDNSVAWLSRDSRGNLQVVKATGSYQPEVISTPQMARLFQQEAYASDSDPTNAYAYVYQVDGHEFYCITFPDIVPTITFCYDASTQLWSQRSGAFSSGVPTRDYVRTATHTTWADDPIIFGDYQENGKLYSVTWAAWDWAGENMERRITGPHISLHNESKFRISEVQVDIQEGVNSGSETGNDGQLTFSYSKDGGTTYSSGVQLELGDGDYDHRLMVRKLGWGRLWNFRIYTDTPNQIVVKGAYGRLAGEPFEGFAQLAPGRTTKV